ncbi:nitrate/nitrite two-component system sensor histidine kinase NarX [Frischella perrara]|uniref:Sensor protein n=1 Tax=Frischella perrara TaxID=1267021 RepID=A0A318MZV4_FRIPE|nr:nitrate/nitrite two-component system sensor histidine kinase NarX [Frischella perrara]PXY96960.1 nitrate/nitrite two-component system sensor histidine kinase NarX [Frischella perrara]
MLKRKIKFSVSIINRLTLFVFFLASIALVALLLSSRFANDTKGSAYMINQLGLLRMKSYQLLSMIPVKQQEYHQLNLFHHFPTSQEYVDILDRYQLTEEFDQLKNDWFTHILPKLKQAKEIESIRKDIELYVNQIDLVVSKLNNKTEKQLSYITQLQMLFIVIILIVLISQIYYLRRYLLAPWNKLMIMADAISRHDFSQRFKIRHKTNEFDLLGLALNNMSEQIESQYALLEEKVTEKTAELQQKNRVVFFQYQAIKHLHTSSPLCERFLIILHDLEKLVPLHQFQIRFYESDDPDHYQQIKPDNRQKLPNCQDSQCSACLMPSKSNESKGIQRYWYLQDSQQKYGMIFAMQPSDVSLTEEQEQLISGLMEQMTMAIMLDRQIEQQKHYLLMKERTAMARELHDSIAQSLSCIKIHLSCLQMQSDLTSSESINLLNIMRKEINMTYSQLRELITSFQLRLNQTGFYANLTELVDEFNKKLQINIAFNYQLPLNVINSKYAINLLQIIREALNNIYKHAKASYVSLDVNLMHDQIIRITIHDNGIGLPSTINQNNHYGLIIMKDRVDLLNGNFKIDSKPNKGTTILITFKITNPIPIKTIEVP